MTNHTSYLATQRSAKNLLKERSTSQRSRSWRGSKSRSRSKSNKSQRKKYDVESAFNKILEDRDK